jgi:hypothetical protein
MTALRATLDAKRPLPALYASLVRGREAFQSGVLRRRGRRDRLAMRHLHTALQRLQETYTLQRTRGARSIGFWRSASQDDRAASIRVTRPTAAERECSSGVSSALWRARRRAITGPRTGKRVAPTCVGCRRGACTRLGRRVATSRWTKHGHDCGGNSKLHLNLLLPCPKCCNALGREHSAVRRVQCQEPLAP